MIPIEVLDNDPESRGLEPEPEWDWVDELLWWDHCEHMREKEQLRDYN